jgi:uncharacterized protein YbjT (DUF2867 family)
MAAIKSVAVSGASGSLGSPLLKALIDAGFEVTALTRASSSATFPSEVKVVKVDYDSVEDLTTALSGQDAVVSTVGFAGMLGQTILVDAAIAAGVKRIIPSEFGSDPEDPRTRSLPVFGYKVQVEKHIKSKVPGTSTTYTLVANNEFFDWDLDNNFGVDVKNKKIEIFDGGEHGYTATPLDMVARGVVGVLQNPKETANRTVRIHGTKMTQNRQLELLQRFTGKDGWNVSNVKLAEREQEGYKGLQNDPSDIFGWVMPMLHCAVFGADFRNDFSKNNDNELLGLKDLTDAEVEEIVRSRA